MGCVQLEPLTCFPSDSLALPAEVAEVLAHLHDHERREHALAEKLMALAEKR